MKTVLKDAKTQGLSMRRRLFIYLAAIMLFLALLLVMLLFFLGAVDPINAEMDRSPASQLENSVDNIDEQSSNQAAYAQVMSRQLTAAIQAELTDAGITFDDLRNDSAALTSVQRSLYEIVRDSMLRVPCSGAFCFLNTTVNDTLPDKSYQGIYLKFENPSSEITIQNEVCLFRGFSAIAVENNISLDNAWQPETRKGVFPEVDTLMSEDSESISGSYLLTSVHPLPDCQETVRLLCVPVADSRGVTIGICGFEISSLYDKLSHTAQETKPSPIFHALPDRSANGYEGQISGDDRSSVKMAQLKLAAFLFITAVFIFVVALWGSKKYLAPVLKDLERNEAALAALRQEKLETASRLDHLQNELRQVQSAYESAQEEISRLAYSRKQEIDPDDFQFFLDGIHILTPAEHKVFDLYLDGKGAKDAIAILSITENTLKYHNKNIYSKLGVSSRKQLLRYAALMKYQEKAI